MRRVGIDRTAGTVRMTSFTGSQQEQDFGEPANCKGFGRIRHFHRHSPDSWSPNPLPIDPAARALGLFPHPDELRAQVFQNAVCNWRCWYCFVDFKLLSGSRQHSAMLTPDAIIELYRAEPDRSLMIDLSGGQPDLVPEWVLWTMEALERTGLASSTYLWSDDNLSNDYFWRCLASNERLLIDSYPMYGKVCCFKGFDAHSFAFNTGAHPDLFDRQFELMRRLLLHTHIDLYAYVTLTTDRADGIEAGVKIFVDRLQELDTNLPLRTVPLRIQAFTPVVSRMHDRERLAIGLQQDAVAAWKAELDRRYGAEQRALAICDVPIRQ
jgi:uncharacterized Fe-S cluster-containing radical SAM superfamily protein